MALAIPSLRKKLARCGSVVSNRGEKIRVAACEVLEQRTLMSAVVVNSVLDQIDPAGSTTVTLRDAIAVANASTTSTTITFNPTVFSTKKAIVLNGTALSIHTATKSQSVIITGPTAGVIISGNGLSAELIVSSTSYASLTGLTFYGGKAANGGGISNAGTVVMQKSTVLGNTATNSGGGIYNTGIMYLIDDTINTNHGVVGGGIWNGNGGSLTMAEDTIAGNTASYGGGVYNNGNPAGTAQMINVTVSNNSASYGAGVFNNTGGSFALSNTIIAGNTRTVTTAGYSDVAGVFASKGYNLIGNADGASGFVSTDRLGHSSALLNAKLNALGNYGGPTQTMTLQSGSPALGTGSTTLAGSFTTDQRGFARIVSGKVDIGAIETQPTTTVLPVPVLIGPGSTTSPGPVLTTFTPTLTWHGITSGITGFQLTVYDATLGKAYNYTLGPTATSFTAPAGVLLPADHFVWNLRAVNGTQTGALSTYLYFQAPPTLPTPTLISPGSTTSPGPLQTSLTPTLKWNAVSGITGYQLTLYDATLGKVTTFTISPTATSFTVPTALAAGHSFVWNLRVLDGTVTGPVSVYLFFRT